MKSILIGTLLVLAGAILAPANVIFDVTVDTSSVAGIGGEISLLLDPENVNPDEFAVTISQFSLGGGSLGGPPETCLLATPCPITGELGSLPLVFTNDAGDPPVLIEYFQEVVWGDSLTFRVVLGGLAVTDPLPNEFWYFDIFLIDGRDGSTLFTGDDPGSIVTFAVEDGVIRGLNFSTGEADISPVEVPEAGTFGLAGLGMLALVYLRRRRSVA